MAAQASPKSGRKKVRCPKCTALFSEPAKSVFECPICACRLSANGAIAVAESPSSPLKEDSAQIKTALEMDEPIKVQSMTSVRKEGSSSAGNGTTPEGNSIGYEQESVGSWTQIYKENQQQLTAETPPGFTSGVGSTTEGVVREVGFRPPIHSVSEQGNALGINERGELLPSPCVEGAKEDGTCQDAPDDASKDISFSTGDTVKEADRSMNGALSKRRHLQSQMFRSSRSEFSFKYSLKGASLLDSDRNLPDRRRVPTSKLVASGATLPDTENTDVPLRTPLRVRISKSQEESSDQSEHGRHSFGSETYSDDDDDGSGSDFDFPAPWAEGLLDVVPPTSFMQNEVFHPNAKAVVSAAPHQLELQENYDSIDNEGLTLQQGPPKAEMPSQVEHAGETKYRESEFRDEESSRGLVHPVPSHEKNHMSLRPPKRSETAVREWKPPSRNSHILDVSDLASMPRDNSTEVKGSLEQRDTGLERTCEEEKLGNMEPSASARQEAFKGVSFEPSGVVVFPDGRQISKMNGQFEGKQKIIITEEENSSSLPSSTDAAVEIPTILHNQEYLDPKQSTSNLNHLNGINDLHRISKSEGFETDDSWKDGALHNHQSLMSSGKIKNERFSAVKGQLADTLSPRSIKRGQLNGVSNARDGNRRVFSSSIEDTEMEEDLYKLPLEAYGNGSISGKSSHLALWAEEGTAMTALSDGTFVNASKARHYHEKRIHHKSLHGKGNGKSVSRLAGSDNNEDRVVSTQEVNLWEPAASQETSVQASSELGDWEGCITAGAEQTGHPALHEMEQNRGPYSQYPVNNALGCALANPQPYALTNQTYPYQLPAQSLVCPAALQNHAFSHCGYRAMCPACMLCSFHQHPHMQPQHIGHCAVCFNQSGSMAYNSGLVEFWNTHQAHHGPGSSCTGSLVDYPQACSSTDRIQRHDFTNAEERSRASSVRNTTQYSPFPKNGAAPYVTCKGCSRVLQVPSDLPPGIGSMQKLRCGACGKVTKFSMNNYDQQRSMVSGTPPPELDPAGGVRNKSPFAQYGDHGRQPYKLDMPSANSALHLHWANDASPEADNIVASRTLEQSSQGRDSYRVQPTSKTSNQHNSPSIIGRVGPNYKNTSSHVGVGSPRNATVRSTNGFGFERSKVNPVASLHSTVDEKEEGLDYGAPRISDGDSLDQSESRMRSPECYQPSGHGASQSSRGGAVTGNQTSEQVSDWNDDRSAQDKKPGSPLLVLINQESTRFRLNLEPRGPFQGSGSAAWSPASDSSVYGKSVNDDDPLKGEKNRIRTHGPPGPQHFVSKGPRYIAGLLRRSLRDFGRGGQ